MVEMDFITIHLIGSKILVSKVITHLDRKLAFYFRNNIFLQFPKRVRATI